MKDDDWTLLRASPEWLRLLPALLERQKQIDKGLRKALDERTVHMLQGAAAELESLIGDPALDAARKEREATHTANAPEPEEEEADNGRGRSAGSDYGRRIADWLRGAGRAGNR